MRLTEEKNTDISNSTVSNLIRGGFLRQSRVDDTPPPATWRDSQGKHLPCCSRQVIANNSKETLALSSVRDEQLALLYQSPTSLDFWITTKIEPNAVSLSKFVKVDTQWLSGFTANFCGGSFFVDEEKKLAVVVVPYLPKSYLSVYKPIKTCRPLASLYVMGDAHGGYLKPLNIIGQATKSLGYFYQFSFSPYVPSLVQINHKKRKHGGF
ncbi:unnamed protein product [Microthlaspi erraticum]|uniref:F-box associated beta-propeller type 1 domain-containing protein n=1 Tax=Microthlaspi erraticum TaxID=1685480 RepID=A0A6D2JA01_9BRAS|nr:unnamed protein product [Microthlaspi erraticum]CAA7037765.1 unnamed protein product [Microthlaspi erraticum]